MIGVGDCGVQIAEGRSCGGLATDGIADEAQEYEEDASYGACNDNGVIINKWMLVIVWGRIHGHGNKGTQGGEGSIGGGLRRGP